MQNRYIIEDDTGNDNRKVEASFRAEGEEKKKNKFVPQLYLRYFFPYPGIFYYFGKIVGTVRDRYLG